MIEKEKPYRTKTILIKEFSDQKYSYNRMLELINLPNKTIEEYLNIDDFEIN